MCLIIYKPRHAEVPLDLLRSAAEHNPDGFGLMSFAGSNGVNVKRRRTTCFKALCRAYRRMVNQECVIHLRLRTQGDITAANTHPFRLTPDLYMAHNGTLDIACRVQGRSDSWHAANDYLGPILRNNPDLLYSQGFQKLLKAWIGPNNRFVFMDARRQKTVIVNREHGVEFRGLWLSNTRWFDAARFGLPRQGQVPMKPLGAGIK
jgi:predicted glutamine amidotransferase